VLRIDRASLPLGRLRTKDNCYLIRRPLKFKTLILYSNNTHNIMKKFLLLTAIACTAAVSAVAPAMADVTPAGSIAVTSTVAASCSTPSASAATVSGYDGTADVTATSTVSFKCTKNTVGTVILGVPSALAAPGTLDTLTATVAFPAGETGARTGAGLSVGAATLTVPSTVTVALGQDVEPAAYAGTIPVTVSY
jgi:uncharacterized protein (UPF0333 family)